MTLLTDTEIVEALASSEQALKIIPFDRQLLRPTCYHFQLGPRFVKRRPDGSSDKGELSEQQPVLRIEPSEYVIAESLEQIVLPPDVIGILGPTRDTIRNGLLLNHTGYVNPPCLRSLEFGITNCTGKEIQLFYGQRMGRISFMKFTLNKGKAAGNGKSRSLSGLAPLRDDDPVHPQDPIEDDEP